MSIHVYQKVVAVALPGLLILAHAACGPNDNSHTTTTTIVPPPPRQVLTAVQIPPPRVDPAGSPEGESLPLATGQFVGVDPNNPLLTFNLANGRVFRLGEVVPIEFSVRNAKLRSEGGDFRIRYIIDDDDAQWVDSQQSFGLTGWVPGKHIIRLELIGPDGWPYRNGNQNIATREITVAP